MSDLFKLIKTPEKSVYSTFGGRYLIAKGKPDWSQGNGRFPSTKWRIYHSDGSSYKTGFQSRDSAVSRLRTDYFLGELRECDAPTKRTYYVKSAVSANEDVSFLRSSKVAGPGVQHFLMTLWLGWARPEIEILRTTDDEAVLTDNDHCFIKIEATLSPDGHAYFLEHLYSRENEDSFDCGQVIEALPDSETEHVPTSPQLLLQQFRERQGYSCNRIIWDYTDAYYQRHRWSLYCQGVKNDDGGATLRLWMETNTGKVITEVNGIVKPPQSAEECTGGTYGHQHYINQYRPVMSLLQDELYNEVIAELEAQALATKLNH